MIDYLIIFDICLLIVKNLISIMLSQRQTKSKITKQWEYFAQFEREDYMPLNTKKYEDYQKLPVYQESQQLIVLYKPGLIISSSMTNNIKIITAIIEGAYLKKIHLIGQSFGIFGKDIYSLESDLLRICVHSGILEIGKQRECLEFYNGFQVKYKIEKLTKSSYGGQVRNGLRSLPIQENNKIGIRPVTLKRLSSLPDMPQLMKYASGSIIKSKRKNQTPMHISQVQSHLKKCLMFNNHMQLAHRYSLIGIGDKGFDRTKYMINQLEEQSLYLETSQKQTYQLCLWEDTVDGFYGFGFLRFSKIKDGINADHQFFKMNRVPLNQEFLQIKHTKFQLPQIVWGNDYIQISKVRYDKIQTYRFFDITRKPTI